MILRNKWFICAFLGILATLGVALDHSVSPNQEISIQFSQTPSQQDDLQETINSITQKLERANVDNIVVKRQADGSLKISYYSSLSIKDIEELLENNTSQVSGFVFSNTKEKKNKEHRKDSYDLTIYTLEKDVDQKGTIGDTAIITELKSESLRSIDHNFNALLNKPLNYLLLGTTYYRHLNLTKIIVYKDDSYKKPEVRAGPVLS